MHEKRTSARAERRAKRLRETAFHEAGHAVAAFFYDVPVRRVTIVPEGDSLGRTIYMPRVVNATRRVFEGYDAKPRDRQMVENKLVSTACGRAAARRLTGRTNYVGADHDLEAEGEIMLRLGYVGDELRLYGRLLDSQARRFVDLRWRQVCDVAEALLARSQLSADELREVMRASIDAEASEMYARLTGPHLSVH
jgi:ATP-dependent Zn protease